jgi:hypothetical protein
MSELERELRALRASLQWPETPVLELRLAPRSRRPGRVVLAVALAVLLALAVAFAVPAARSALLRVLHLGGVSVERVDTLPATSPRPLGADLGAQVTRERAARVLGRPVAAPAASVLRLRGGVISAVLPGPLLLSELRTGPVPTLQKQLAGSATKVAWLVLNGEPALWLTGARHLARFPDAPPRLAGHVLVWQSGPVTYRLEGPRLSRATAVALARRLTGT